MDVVREARVAGQGEVRPDHLAVHQVEDGGEAYAGSLRLSPFAEVLGDSLNERVYQITSGNGSMPESTRNCGRPVGSTTVARLRSMPRLWYRVA